MYQAVCWSKKTSFWGALIVYLIWALKKKSVISLECPWMLLGGDFSGGCRQWATEWGVPRPARGRTPDSSGLFERRQVSVTSFWNTGLFQLLSLNCSSLCHQRLGSHFAPFPPCPVLTCARHFCGPGPLQLWPPARSDVFGLRPLPAHESGSLSQSAHRALGSPGHWGQAQSHRHHQIVLLWIGDFAFSVDFAFSFIKCCLRENA